MNDTFTNISNSRMEQNLMLFQFEDFDSYMTST